jgi:hypothetical protein
MAEFCLDEASLAHTLTVGDGSTRTRTFSITIYDPQTFEVVLVADIPWPHSPFKCRHRDRFDAMSGPRARQDWREGQQSFKAFFATLTDGDADACEYHQVDWSTAAGIAVEILRENTAAFDWITVEEMTRARADEDPIVGAVSSIFSEPIRWSRSEGVLTNGQHRVCALRRGGVLEVVVATV